MTIQQMQQDDVAMSVARAVAAANHVAATRGIDPAQSLVTITEESGLSGDAWKVEYGTRDYLHLRGGDLIILVDKETSEIQQVQLGQ